MAEKYTFKQFQAQYPDDDACLLAIFRRAYGDEPICPGCGVIGSTFHKISKRRAFACAQCGHHIYPCAGTIFEKSSTLLTLWFHAMYLMTATRNGVSAKELQRQLGVTYKCAWRIGHQLRLLMAARDESSNPGPMSGHVEMDETFVGGKLKNRKGKMQENKTVVFGIVQRGSHVKGFVVPNAQRETLVPLIQRNVTAGTMINSDGWRAYRCLRQLGYKHEWLNHRVEEYVRDIHHTNSVEGFWSHLKRGISSTHVAVAPHHLQKYVGEFAFRYNHRHAPEAMFQIMLAQVSKPISS